uniref:Putative ixodes 8-cys protein n=1 Tax=Ixodes ricinus TaxID=34613 RepID=A0A0K8RAT1_IXORI
MKVVCIVLLFVIAAEAASNGRNSVVDASNGKNNTIEFKFPPYIPNHHLFASNLVTMCKNYTPTSEEKKRESGTTYKPRINDLHVNFKECTFLCKREFGNVTLKLPAKTPCGPNKQTCENKEKCVPYIPGC